MAIPFKPCVVDDCKNNGHWKAGGARGFCNSHYLRLQRHGDPEAGKGRRPRREEHEAFLRGAMAFTEDECLIWPFNRGSSGYAQMMVDGEQKQVCRIICEMVHGPEPIPSCHAAHSCGKGDEGCINPRHLSWKSPADNMADKIIHGTWQGGENNAWAKLTQNDVVEIRRLSGAMTSKEIAKRFGVSKDTVNRVISRRAWAHVP